MKHNAKLSEDVTDIKPYGSESGKEKEVEAMFDNIAPAYDFMNAAMSFGLHNRWRSTALKRLVAKLKRDAEDDAALHIVDIATGTGDVAFALHNLFPKATITGIDLSEGMLEVARKKKKKKYPGAPIEFIQGDSLKLPIEDATVDAITVAYGVRNFANLEQGLREMRRVLKPGGTLCIIELSEPKPKLTKFLYRLYARHFIPMVGRIVSGDNGAYTYLPRSIAACPQRQEMTQLMLNSGFKDAEYGQLTLGAVCIYLGSL